MHEFASISSGVIFSLLVVMSSNLVKSIPLEYTKVYGQSPEYVLIDGNVYRLHQVQNQREFIDKNSLVSGNQHNYLDQANLNKMDNSKERFENQAQRTEGQKIVGNKQSHEVEGEEKLLKHKWDRGSGYVKKWEWDKGEHYEQENSELGKHHQASIKDGRFVDSKERLRKEKGNQKHLHHDRLRQFDRNQRLQQHGIIQDHADEAENYVNDGRRTSLRRFRQPNGYFIVRGRELVKKLAPKRKLYNKDLLTVDNEHPLNPKQLKELFYGLFRPAILGLNYL